MDPDQALYDLRLQAAAVIDVADDMPDGLVVMAERFRVLDDWLSEGGFLPKRWAR